MQTQLEFPGYVGLVGYLAESLGAEVRNRGCEQRCVERVVRLSPELCVEPLLDGEVLEQTGIPVGHTGAAAGNIARYVSESIRGRGGEGRRIEVTQEPRFRAAGIAGVHSGRVGPLVQTADSSVEIALGHK